MATRKFTSISEAISYLKDEIISDALHNEVSDTVKEVMSETIKNSTYNRYTPDSYKRRGDDGGLSDIRNMDSILINNTTVSIKNNTKGNSEYVDSLDGYDSGNIDEIIVSGRGYRWQESRIYNMQIPRDFYSETEEELQNTNEHTYAMYNALKRRGIDVRIKK